MIDPEDLANATLALLQWLQTQEIAIEDAPMVLANTIVSVVHSIALDRGSNPQDGIKMVNKDMMRLIKELP